MESPDGDDSLFRSCFSACHLVGMLSALANPILYGYFNQVQYEKAVWKDAGLSVVQDTKEYLWALQPLKRSQHYAEINSQSRIKMKRTPIFLPDGQITKYKPILENQNWWFFLSQVHTMHLAFGFRFCVSFCFFFVFFCFFFVRGSVRHTFPIVLSNKFIYSF